MQFISTTYKQPAATWLVKERSGHWLRPCWALRQRVIASIGSESSTFHSSSQPSNSRNHRGKPSNVLGVQSDSAPQQSANRFPEQNCVANTENVIGQVAKEASNASNSKEPSYPDLAAGHKHAQFMLRIMTVLQPAPAGSRNTSYSPGCKHACLELASLCRTKGADLPITCLVQQAVMLKKLYAAMGRNRFSSSPADCLVYPLIIAASKSYHMQQADLGTWSVLLHNLLPLQTPSRSMQPLFGSCWTWMARRGEAVWIGRPAENDIKPWSVALLVWSLATAEYRGNLEPLSRGLNAAVKSHVMSGASAFDWATTLWAAAKLNIHSRDIKSVWDAGLRFMTLAISRGTCNMQDVSMCFHAAAVSEFKPAYSALTSALATALATPDVSIKLKAGCQPRAFASILMSVSKMFPAMVKPGERLAARRAVQLLVQELVEVVSSPMLDRSLSQQLVIAVTALSDMGIFNPQLYAVAIDLQKTRLLTSLEGASHLATPAIDAVCVLYAAAQTYPGLWHSLQPELSSRPHDQIAPSGSISESTLPGVDLQADLEHTHHNNDGQLADNELLGSFPPGSSTQGSLVTVTMVEVEQGLDDARALLGILGKCDMSDWSDMTLGNVIWAWAALLPSTYFGTPVKRTSQSRSKETTDQDLNTVVASKVIDQFLLRDVSSFSPAALTQLYTAYIEMSDRQLLKQHFGGLGNNTALLKAARQAWLGFTQAEERSTISKYQEVIAERAKSLRWRVHMEAWVPVKNDGETEDSHVDSSGSGLEPMHADIVLTRKRKAGGMTAIAVEVDGAHHYLDPNWSYNGKTALKHNQLKRRVGKFVTVSVQKWRQLAKVEEQLTYLRQLLKTASDKPGTR